MTILGSPLKGRNLAAEFNGLMDSYFEYNVPNDSESIREVMNAAAAAARANDVSSFD